VQFHTRPLAKRVTHKRPPKGLGAQFHDIDYLNSGVVIVTKPTVKIENMAFSFQQAAGFVNVDDAELITELK